MPEKTAQSLTKRVRERDGGLPGVEAVTLPYSNERWEVACNLSQPNVASSDDIDNLVKSLQDDNKAQDFVEMAYRVGTTAEQCRQAIKDFVMKSCGCSTMQKWRICYGRICPPGSVGVFQHVVLFALKSKDELGPGKCFWETQSNFSHPKRGATTVLPMQHRVVLCTVAPAVRNVAKCEIVNDDKLSTRVNTLASLLALFDCTL